MLVPVIRKTIFLLTLAAGLGGCSLYKAKVPLSVVLPPVPGHWQTAFPHLRYCLCYPAPGGGDAVECRINGTDRVQIDFPKVSHLPLLAYPLLPADRRELAPAGGVYPLDCDGTDDVLTLSWEQGAAAAVLLRLWMAGIDCRTINAARLSREMRERAPADPWDLDLDRICAALAAGDLRVTDIRPAASRDLRLKLDPGFWFLESPFRLPVSAEPDGTLLLPSVPLGGHALFESAGQSWYLLYVREGEVLLKQGG